MSRSRVHQASHYARGQLSRAPGGGSPHEAGSPLVELARLLGRVAAREAMAAEGGPKGPGTASEGIAP